MSTAATAVARRGGLFRHADFMKLWTAETVSQFGSQVTALAIPLVAVVLLNANAFQVGLLTTIDFLPFLVVGLPAGVWVDRMRRRPILIVGDLGRALTLLSIPVAFAFNALTIYQLYVVGFVTGVLTVFFDVAYQSYLPHLVEREHLVEGNGKLEISRSAAQLAGPGLAGLLIGIVGAAIAILADALSFVGSALFVFLIRKREPAPEVERHADGERIGMRQQIAEGLHYVGGNRHLRAIAACTATSNLFSNLAFALYVLYAVKDLRLEPAMIGLIFGIGNVGTLLGAVLAGRIARWLGVGPTIVLSALLFGPGMLLVPLATPETAVPLLIAAGAIGGLSAVVYNVTQVSYRQAITPDGMQGRMTATMRFVVWGTIPVGSMLGGVLGQAIGVREAMFVGAIGGIGAFLPVLFSPVRSLREMPQPLSVSSTLDDVDDGRLPVGSEPLIRDEEGRDR